MEEKEIRAYIEDEATDLCRDWGYKVNDRNPNAMRNIVGKWWSAKETLRGILRRHPKWDEDQQAIVFEANFDTAQDKLAIRDFCIWCRRNTEMIFGDDYDKRSMYYRFFTPDNFQSETVDEDFVSVTEKLGNPDLVAKVGQKTSRAVNKICRAIGLSEIKDMREVEHGGVTQMKDYGYNYYFAKFGDAINPLHITRYTVISINFLDYLTMSNGTDWASCQLPDKYNSRDLRSTYDHCYASGTLSYALDEATVIFYTVSPSWSNNKEMWKAPKERRMNYHVAPDGKAMIFGRLYPDGRDGGETGLAAQFRKTMQKILSECTESNNLWKTEKGTGVISGHYDDFGTHYRDYKSYADCGITSMVDAEIKKIFIGHDPICPNCGTVHCEEKSLNCADCDGDFDAYCGRCGEGINTDSDDYIYCEDNERYYCCEDCARRDDVVQTVDYEWHLEDNCCHDDWDDEYYYMDWSDGVSPDGCCWYASESHCREDGWIEIDGDWHRQDDCEIDAYTEEWFVRDDDECVTPDDGDHWYKNVENCIADGWAPTAWSR